MPSFISFRRHIKWEGEEEGEPTSTLVLTSGARRFVDLRFVSDSGLSELAWAIAGLSTSRPVTSKDGKEVWHCQWRHWIDSHTKDAESATDEGILYPREDGLTLEKGRMKNPATGMESDYEELWYDPPPARDVDGSDDKFTTVVLMWEGNEEQRGMVVRVAQWCQGFLRDGDGIACERWEWARGEKQWRMRARVCAGGMEESVPCSETFGGGQWAVGDEVVKAGRAWEVVESEEE